MLPPYKIKIHGESVSHSTPFSISMERDENFQITLIFLFKERKTQKENQSKGLKTLANEKEERREVEK